MNIILCGSRDLPELTKWVAKKISWETGLIKTVLFVGFSIYRVQLNIPLGCANVADLFVIGSLLSDPRAEATGK